MEKQTRISNGRWLGRNRLFAQFFFLSSASPWDIPRIHFPVDLPIQSAWDGDSVWLWKSEGRNLSEDRRSIRVGQFLRISRQSVERISALVTWVVKFNREADEF